MRSGLLLGSFVCFVVQQLQRPRSESPGQSQEANTEPGMSSTQKKSFDERKRSEDPLNFSLYTARLSPQVGEKSPIQNFNRHKNQE